MQLRAIIMENTNFLKKNRRLIILAIFAAVILSVFFFPKNKEINVSVNDDSIIEKKVLDYHLILNSVEAKSFYVYDILESKAIFSKDEHLKLPLASITKLMSGLVILDIMPDPTIVTITGDDIATEGDSDLIVGEKWKLKELLDFSLMHDCCNKCSCKGILLKP